ncbi:MAG: hypothetical protein AAF771_14830 [Pseudomonadota bacterium]
MRVLFGPIAGVLLAACAAADAGQAAFDAETSRLMAALPPGEFVTYMRIADALASNCRTVQRRRGVPSDQDIRAAVLRSRDGVAPGETVIIRVDDPEIIEAFTEKHGLEDGYGTRACAVAETEMREQTLIGRLLR